MHSPLIWWQALKPRHKALIKGLGWAMLGIAAVYIVVVEIPHWQAAPLKAKIQRERDKLPPHERLKLEHDARKLEHDARTAYIQGLGGAALLIGLLFTWRSIRVTERNLRITQDTATKNLAIAQDGQITERFTRAVEQLGSDKLEVRLGAIYALERIARDSERDHWPIMEILTAYVRENVPRNKAEQPPLGSMVLSKQSNQSPPKPATDIQAILTVLGRRTRTYGKGEDQSLDLMHTDLRRARLVAAHLERADFEGAHLEGANLQHAHLERAMLQWAYLERANLMEAHLEGADLHRAHLEGANLQEAHLEGAFNLTVEQLSTVETLYQAHLDLPLLEQIQQQHPHLLEEPKD